MRIKEPAFKEALLKFASYLIALIIVLGVLGIAYNGKLSDLNIQSSLAKIEASTAKIERSLLTKDNVPSCPVNDALIVKVEQQARYILTLEQENEDLKAQAKTFGWWKEGEE